MGGMSLGKKSKTILIVEDESTLNEAYQIVLATAGYNILSAFDGSEALEIAEKNKIDLILLDLRLPVLDGIGFLKSYKKHKRSTAKVIILSNYDLQKEIEEAYSLGADRYILKAWASPKELLKVVDDTLRS